MAIATGPLNREASLPTAIPTMEWSSGAPSQVVARRRARVRQRFFEELCSLSQYWYEILEDQLPEDLLWTDDVRVTVVAAEDRDVIQEAADRVTMLRLVHIPTPD